MKVLKFGGTSVGSAARFKNVAKIVVPAGKNMVVLSAMAGTTNTLLDIARSLYDHNPQEARDTINVLKHKYLNVVEELYTLSAFKQKAQEFVDETFSYLLSFT